MKTELSIGCDFITNYEEAKEEQRDGNTVWTITDKNGNESIEQKLIKKDGIGFIIIPKVVEEIILFRREKWTANIKVS